MGSAMIMYFKPALLSYLAVGRRAGLSDQADTAVRMMASEIRSAVPNSLRVSSSTVGGVISPCFELIPTSDGGRFRTGPDTVRDAAVAGASAFIDMTKGVTEFDVLTQFSTLPVAGDYVVIGNQNADDAYKRTNMAMIASVTAPAAPTGTQKALGTWRVTLDQTTTDTTLRAPKQFPYGYDGGRFVIVPKAKQAVTYFCSQPGTDSKTTGTGTLYRFSGYGFNASLSCPAPTATTPKLATEVGSCSFSYNPNAGATQESGFMQIQLQLIDEGEAVSLSYGVHVDNVP
jgi:MSHA biogenesis protein MshO